MVASSAPPLTSDWLLRQVVFIQSDARLWSYCDDQRVFKTHLHKIDTEQCQQACTNMHKHIHMHTRNGKSRGLFLMQIPFTIILALPDAVVCQTLILCLYPICFPYLCTFLDFWLSKADRQVISQAEQFCASFLNFFFCYFNTFIMTDGHPHRDSKSAVDYTN